MADVDGDGDADMSIGEAVRGGLDYDAVPDTTYNGDDGNDGGGGGGDSGCFVTTATVNVIGERDDGTTLSKLRELRDHYTLYNHRGKERVHLYYDIAPRIVSSINKKSDKNDVWVNLYHTRIVP
ncbi:MAG: hypothetical protein CUN56_15385, partial [Phototrophicales bacterium]